MGHGLCGGFRGRAPIGGGLEAAGVRGPVTVSAPSLDLRGGQRTPFVRGGGASERARPTSCVPFMGTKTEGTAVVAPPDVCHLRTPSSLPRPSLPISPKMVETWAASRFQSSKVGSGEPLEEK